MTQPDPRHGLSTLVNHLQPTQEPRYAHIPPIYQTTAFSFPDVATGVAIEEGRQPGYVYTRLANPNADLLAHKYAYLEGLDLLRRQPQVDPGKIVAGRVFASGMAAIAAAVLARVRAGDTVIAQRALYGNTFNFLHDLAPTLGIQVVFVDDPSSEGWAAALEKHPKARLLYVETPVNPTMQVIDLAAVVELARTHDTWVLVDNTFATPYGQRPLTLGADVVVHSTTKYLSGHGVTIGGAVVSRHPDYIQGPVQVQLELFGAAPSPFDAWLADLGLRTFEIRMQRHCENAGRVARFLAQHPKVSAVHYPGLESSPGYAVARRQMLAFGGMLSFELAGGLQAGARLMDRVRVATLAVSLGNADTLIEHPASMTHSSVPREERLRTGITDGLVRLSVGIENVEDLIADLEQALS